MKKLPKWLAAACGLLTCVLLAATPAIAQVDPCEGKPLCENPGPFVAEIMQASPSMHGNNHHIRVIVRVRNTGAEPLVLGYVQNSGVMEDELGNRYTVDWRYREHVSGIGQVGRSQADAQFVLAPGAARSFTLIYQRFAGRSPQIARSYSPALTLAQLQPLSPTQVRTVSEYSLNYSGMGIGGLQSADAIGRGLRELLRGRGR